MSPVAMDGDSPYPAWKQNPHATDPPYANQPPPKPKTPPASAAPEDSGHSWTIWSGGPAVVVSGGTVSVNTSDLDSLASSLNSAAGSLDDARTLIANVVTEVNEAPPPPVSPPSIPYPILAGLDLEKSNALQALDALTTGPGSLEAVAGTLRGIASDVTACSQAHTLADGKAAPVNGLVGPVDVRAFDAGLLQLALGSSAVAQFPTISALLASSTMGGWVLYKLVEDSEDGQAAVEVLQLLLSDPTTEQWVKEDLVRIVLLTRWLKNAKTGREAATVQAYLQQVSQRLDPWAKQRLPGQVAVGTQTVDTKSLTPMQRVAMVLGANAAAIGAGVYGTQSGVTVTPVGGNGSTVLPPAAKDPFGLASAVNPGMTGKGKETKSPQSISETITHCQEVQSSKNSLGQGYEEAGVISIQRVEHADGRVSWVVYVPGTTDWTSGDGGPHRRQRVLQLVVQPAQELLVTGPRLLLGLASTLLHRQAQPAADHGRGQGEQQHNDPDLRHHQRHRRGDHHRSQPEGRIGDGRRDGHDCHRQHPSDPGGPPGLLRGGVQRCCGGFGGSPGHDLDALGLSRRPLRVGLRRMEVGRLRMVPGVTRHRGAGRLRGRRPGPGDRHGARPTHVHRRRHVAGTAVLRGRRTRRDRGRQLRRDRRAAHARTSARKR